PAQIVRECHARQPGPVSCQAQLVVGRPDSTDGGDLPPAGRSRRLTGPAPAGTIDRRGPMPDRPVDRVPRLVAIGQLAEDPAAGQGARTQPMTHSPRLALASLSLLGALSLGLPYGSPCASGQESQRFRPLFNGKDLSGWVTPEDKSLFTVEDRQIVGRTEGKLKKNEFLATAKSYGDFVLKAKVKIRNGNS